MTVQGGMVARLRSRVGFVLAAGALGCSTVAAVSLATVAVAGAQEVSSLSATTGPTAGGRMITVNGSGYDPDSSNDSVQFINTLGGQIADGTIISVASDGTYMVVTTPPQVYGVSDVIVTADGTPSLANPGDEYTYLPTLLSDTDTSSNNSSPGVASTGGVTGDSVILSGSGFEDADGNPDVTNVEFPLKAPASPIQVTSFAVLSDSEISVVVPLEATPSTFHFSVVTLDGASFNANADLYYYVAPTFTISHYAPHVGPLSGAAIKVNATGFAPGDTEVNWNGVPGAVLPADVSCAAKSCSFTAPSGSAGKVFFSLTNVALGTTTGTESFIYDPVPVVSSLNPATGAPGGGTIVEVIGTGLFAGSIVYFGATKITPTHISSNGEVLKFKTPPGTAGDIVAVSVTTPGGPSATSANFEYFF